jgi:hypothetical protein
MKPKLSEIKQRLENFVLEGVPEEGFIVNSFTFSIPEEIEKFFNDIVDEIYALDAFLDIWLSRQEQAIFVLAYRDYFSSEERNYGLNRYKKDEFTQDLERYPAIYLGFNVFFETKNLSPKSLEKIENHKHLFKDFSKDEEYVSLYWRSKNFDISFDYYWEVL